MEVFDVRMTPWRMLGLIIMILAVGHSSDMDGYACLSTEITSNFIRLHFNTSILWGIAGNCSCKFDLTDKSYFNMETKGFIIQNCTDGYPAFTVITHQIFIFTCKNNQIETTTAQNLSVVEHNAGDILWLIVSKSRDSPVYSGSLGIHSEYAEGLIGDDFSVICYEPNQNIPSAPNTQNTKSTSTISMTTSTGSSFTTPSTALSISNKDTRITSEATTMMQHLLHETSHETSTYSEPSQIMSTMGSSVSPESQLGNQVPVAAIAGGAVGAVAVLMIFVILVACYRYRCVRCVKEIETSPESRDHPTYCDLANRENTEYLSIKSPEGIATITESKENPTYCDLSDRENTEYEHIDHNGHGSVNYINNGV